MITPKATGTPQKVTATQNSNLIMMTPKAPKATKNNKWQQKVTKDTPKSNQATTKQRQVSQNAVAKKKRKIRECLCSYSKSLTPTLRCATANKKPSPAARRDDVWTDKNNLATSPATKDRLWTLFLLCGCPLQQSPSLSAAVLVSNPEPFWCAGPVYTGLH